MHAAIRGSICVLMLLLVVARAAIAQDLLTVSGVVTTRADGMPVPGATVSVVGVDASATTDASGSYVLQAPRARVPGNRMQLKVDALGLPATLIDVAIDGATVTVNSFNGIQTFPRQSPFGMNGRAIYARIGRRF